MQARATGALDRLGQKQALVHQQLGLADKKAAAALRHLEELAGQPGAFLKGLQGVDGSVQQLGQQALQLQGQLAQLQEQLGAQRRAAAAQQA